MCSRGSKSFRFPVTEEPREVVAGGIIHRCGIENERREDVAKALERLAALIRRGTHELMGFKVRRASGGGEVTEIIASFCPTDPEICEPTKRGRRMQLRLRRRLRESLSRP